MKYPFRNIINFIGLGVLISIFFLLILLIPYTLFLNEFIIINKDNNILLIFLIFGLFILGTMLESTLAYYLIKDEVNRYWFVLFSIFSFLAAITLLWLISFITLWNFNINIFSKVSEHEIILIIPQTLVYFGIFILPEIIFLFILNNIFYFGFFMLLLRIKTR